MCVCILCAWLRDLASKMATVGAYLPMAQPNYGSRDLCGVLRGFQTASEECSSNQLLCQAAATPGAIVDEAPKSLSASPLSPARVPIYLFIPFPDSLLWAGGLEYVKESTAKGPGCWGSGPGLITVERPFKAAISFSKKLSRKQQRNPGLNSKYLSRKISCISDPAKLVA